MATHVKPLSCFISPASKTNLHSFVFQPYWVHFFHVDSISVGIICFATSTGHLSKPLIEKEEHRQFKMWVAYDYLGSTNIAYLAKIMLTKFHGSHFLKLACARLRYEFWSPKFTIPHQYCPAIKSHVDNLLFLFLKYANFSWYRFLIQRLLTVIFCKWLLPVVVWVELSCSEKRRRAKWNWVLSFSSNERGAREGGGKEKNVQILPPVIKIGSESLAIMSLCSICLEKTVWKTLKFVATVISHEVKHCFHVFQTYDLGLYSTSRILTKK